MVNTLDVRPFLPLDVPLVHRLTALGTCLDSASELTRGIHAVEGAMWGAVPLADLGTPTFVLRDGENGYVAQYRHRSGDQHAHIVFIAPLLRRADDEIAWSRLIRAMIISAGRRGAYTLNAEVHEESSAFDILRRDGFAVFARQQIWRREPAPLVTRPARCGTLRTSTDLDAIGINALYAGAVSRLVRQAEMPPDPRHGLVYVVDGRIAGYFSAQEGKFGIFVQSVLSPELSPEMLGEAVTGALSGLPRADKLPVYFSVRRYQEWLNVHLENSGFEPGDSQAVMVRHTTRRIEHCAYKFATAPEGLVIAGAPPVKEFWSPLVSLN